ncbi:hypothetical protein C2869_14160 [Saccharobesus litoralis]|uniref:EAL domain-containing protein n=1 Tax=Saccharobesus litoralis TaxID=2172099 RepID=A0A2S0VTJ8_9ALTE|nr:EAL domain-containing protein [Saccharobesus litoralis]AWB67513.1 hypothetical protein C2869_14160 [Saccharobesus litoralis]
MPEVESVYARMPIVDVVTQQSIGFEVLLRQFRGIGLAVFNQHPTLFKELAQPLFEHILALDKAGKFRQSQQKLFVNLTLEQLLSDGLLSCFEDLFFAVDKPNNIIFELTEHELNYDRQRMKERMLICRQLGFSFAIDDFGAKASNFRRVFELNPDIVKLDRSVFNATNSDKNDLSALSHLIDLCHKEGKKVVLEGVETHTQLQQAKQCKVDFVQGFYFGLPENIL